MASGYHTPFRARKSGKTGGVVRPGGPDGITPKAPAHEKTARWPSAGPEGPNPFNKRTRWPVVKTTAAKQGIC